MAKANLTPGTKTPISGQYILTGPRGGTSGNPEITAVRGKPLPPTQEPGFTYTLVDPTRHNN